MSSTRSYHDEGPSPSRPAEIIQLLCEAMRFALAENAAREEKEEKKKEREKGGGEKKGNSKGRLSRRGWSRRAKDANSIVSVIGNALCVLVSRVLMMESRVDVRGGGCMMTEETIQPPLLII